jgi:putative colanic acid biosynthesis acetyltransferase WcaF
MDRNLRAFSGHVKYSPSGFIRLALWVIIQNTIFKTSFFPSLLRIFALRTFGASIGSGVQIRRGVRIHFPWKLEIGDNCWIGEEVWFINHEQIKIGSNVCISQRSILCSGGHNFRSASLEYSHKPIEIKDGAWLCLDAKILPGVTIGQCSVVSAGEVVHKSIPDFSMLVGGELRPIELSK